MKCPNCGFDADNQVNCPICGSQLPAAAPAQNPYGQQPVNAPQNPYAQQPVSAPQNPYAQQPVSAPQTSYAQQPVNAPQNPYAQQPVSAPQNPYAQQPAPVPEPAAVSAPEPDYYPGVSSDSEKSAPFEDIALDFDPNIAPQQPAPVQAPQAPVPPAPAPYAEDAPRKKKGNGGFIALAVIVGSVVLIGIVITLFSVFLNNNSIIEEFAKRNAQSSSEVIDNEPDSYWDDDAEDDDPDNLELIQNAVPVGEAVEFSDGTVVLESVTVEKETLKYDPDRCQYGFTVTVKNTDTKTHSYYVDIFEILNPNGEYNDDFEYLYTYGDTEMIIGTGQSQSIYCVYEGPKDYGTVYLNIDSDTVDEHSLFCFAADLSKAEKSE